MKNVFLSDLQSLVFNRNLRHFSPVVPVLLYELVTKMWVRVSYGHELIWV